MRSHKPIAKQFRKGVKKILKEIRLNGEYSSKKRIEECEAELSKALEKIDLVEGVSMTILDDVFQLKKENRFQRRILKYLEVIRPHGEYITINEFVEIATVCALCTEAEAIKYLSYYLEKESNIPSADTIKNGYMVIERVVAIDEKGARTVEKKGLLTKEGVIKLMRILEKKYAYRRQRA